MTAHDDTGDIAPRRVGGGARAESSAVGAGVGGESAVAEPLTAVAEGAAESEKSRVFVCPGIRNLTGSAVNARIWLKMGHPDFDGVAPIDLLKEGRVEAVEDLVLAIEKGSPR